MSKHKPGKHGSHNKPQRAKFSKVMSEFGAGTLKSGSGGAVTGHKQALAIAFSEARKRKG